MQTHRNIAKRKALYWQVGAVALLATAGAAIALPQIRTFFAPAAPNQRTEVTPPPPPKPTDYSKLEIVLAGKGASATGSQVAAAPPPPVPDPTAAVPQGPVAEAPLTAWEYLGSIITPSKRSALVRVDGQQQIYSIGSTHGDAKLATIETGFIEVEMGADKEMKKIALKERVLLAPTDPPKHPVPARQPMAMGTGPGGQMNFNAPSRGTSPAGTLDNAMADRARMAALAANEAAARAKQGADVPGMAPLEKMEPGEVEMASKYLSDPSIADDSRGKYMRMLGIGPGASPDAAMSRLKEAGVDLSGDAYKRILQAVQNNSQSKP